MNAVTNFVGLRNNGVDSLVSCPADFAAATHAADAANGVSFHVVASVFLALTKLSPGAGDLPIAQFSLSFRTIGDINRKFSLDWTACDGLADMGRLVAATAASVGDDGLYELADSDFDRTFTVNSVTTLPQFRAHAVTHAPPAASWLSGSTPSTVPPLTFQLLVDPVTGSLGPLAYWRANAGPFLTHNMRNGRFYGMGAAVLNAAQSRASSFAGVNSEAFTAARWWTSTQVHPSVRNLYIANFRSDEDLDAHLLSPKDVFRLRFVDVLRALPSLGASVGVSADAYDRAVVLGSSLNADVSSGSLAAFQNLDTTLSPLLASLGLGSDSPSAGVATERVAKIIAHHGRLDAVAGSRGAAGSDGGASRGGANTGSSSTALSGTAAYHDVVTQLRAASLLPSAPWYEFLKIILSSEQCAFLASPSAVTSSTTPTTSWRYATAPWRNSLSTSAVASSPSTAKSSHIWSPPRSPTAS